MQEKKLVVNLRYLNRFLCKHKFKYEDLRIVTSLFERGEYMFMFDLKSGYHHIDISASQQNYLGFSWEMESKNNFMCSQYYLLVWPQPVTSSQKY